MMASTHLAAEERKLPNPGTKGWWWYEPFHKEAEKSEADEKAMSQPLMKTYTYDDLWNMHPDQFSKLIDERQKLAVQTLKEDDVRDFYLMVDIARKKSLAFANVASYIIQKYPDLNVAKDYPSNYPGRMAMLAQTKADMIQVISGAVDEYALLYFYEDACYYCEAQDQIMDMFQNQYEWTVRKVDIHKKPAMAGQFGVTMVPTVILIQRGGGYLPVSVGAVALDEFEQLLYRAIRYMSGETAPENFNLYQHQAGSAFDVSKAGGVFETVSEQNQQQIQ